MANISWLLTGVAMFMIMFGFTFLAWEISEDKIIIFIITFIGISIAVILAYPLLQIFESIYENENSGMTDQKSGDTK